MSQRGFSDDHASARIGTGSSSSPRNTGMTTGPFLPDGEALVYDVEVDERFRGQGLGTTLMRRLIATTDTEGLTLVLDCAEARVAWYERLGFHRVGPGEGEDARMRHEPAREEGATR